MGIPPEGTEAWKRLSHYKSSRQTYEQIEPSTASIGKEHVVLHNTAAVPDADVPLLAASATDWQLITAEVPGFTPQMLNVADLLYKTDNELVKRLNDIMEPVGLTQVYHVADAINRASSKFLCVAEKQALELALDTFFAEIAVDALECRQQWPTCINWMRTRVAVAHPLTRDPPNRIQRLRQIHASIQTQEEYDVVREVATAMAACLASMWNTTL